MVSFDVGADLAERFRAHAGDRTHLYGYAVRGLTEDWAVPQHCWSVWPTWST